MKRDHRLRDLSDDHHHALVLARRATMAAAGDGAAPVRVWMASGSDSPEAVRLRRRASLLGRLDVLLSLVLVALAVMMVRGVPW